ncbi:hypothetical protein COV13_00830 [Candidatus Woesearchaeota archaeon CG10_big_fil_rev_8_21_14_0_10_32_9]|nr:MAG: hypothetical protein COV13_00830 [Candidatus Woesearchaeota archaeon CG10_big_fil_rev_8_21_14_0_10_32_9]
MKKDASNEDKLREIKSCINKKDSLYCIPKDYAARFEEKSRNEGKGTIAIMTYGDDIIYLKAESSALPKIPLSKFNYTSGTFEKKWGPNHKTIVLTPNYSSVRKVEIEIQGIDIHKMRLLPDKKGDVVEDRAKIKITRHYRFAEGDSENKIDTHSASPGEKRARKIVVKDKYPRK